MVGVLGIFGIVVIYHSNNILYIKVASSYTFFRQLTFFPEDGIALQYLFWGLLISLAGSCVSWSISGTEESNEEEEKVPSALLSSDNIKS